MGINYFAFFSVNPVNPNLQQTQQLQGLKDNVRPDRANYGNTLAEFSNTCDQLDCSSYDVLSKDFIGKEVVDIGTNNLKDGKKPQYDSSNYCVESGNSKQLDAIKMEFHHTSSPESQRKSQASYLSQTSIEKSNVEQGNVEAVNTFCDKDTALSGNKEQTKVMKKPLLEVGKYHVNQDSDYMETNSMDLIYKNRPVSTKERWFSLFLFLLLLNLL